MSSDHPSDLSFDALLPPAMAAKVEAVGVRKAHLPTAELFALSVLAGAFIALGAGFATVVAAGGGLPFGVQRLLSGVVFSLGLILVVVGGAELFTGNNLIVMAWANRRVSTRLLLRNWGVVYLGNFAGALTTALLVLWSGQHEFAGGQIGLQALAIAEHKAGLSFGRAVALGILCNGLVCLAVWLTFSARSTTDRIMAIVPPIAAFVAAGFEHSVANMYFIPLGMLIKATAAPTFWEAIGRIPADYPHLTVTGLLVNNLLPVTLGNIAGGAILVGVFYWFIYLRPHK